MAQSEEARAWGKERQGLWGDGVRCVWAAPCLQTPNLQVSRSHHTVQVSPYLGQSESLKAWA